MLHYEKQPRDKLLTRCVRDHQQILLRYNTTGSWILDSRKLIKDSWTLEIRFLYLSVHLYWLFFLFYVCFLYSIKILILSSCCLYTSLLQYSHAILIFCLSSFLTSLFLLSLLFSPSSSLFSFLFSLFSLLSFLSFLFPPFSFFFSLLNNSWLW